MTQIADTLTIDSRKRTHDGYLVVRARAARTGVYEYRADEIGAPADQFQPTDIVNVYRDEGEVFSEDSVRSFIGRPVTNDHPRHAVTADNWRRHARGTVMGAMRDKEFLAFDLTLMDRDIIADVESGKTELSNGYQSDLLWEAGTSPDGQKYDARMTNIRGNHVALVDRGRAGSKCAIGDGGKFAVCDALDAAAVAALTTKEGRVKLINLDGMSVNLNDPEAVEQALKRLDAKVTDATEQKDTAEKALSDAKGEKAAIESQLSDAKKALEPAALDQLVSDRTSLISTATKLVDSFDATGKSDSDIRRAVVDAKLGDSAEGMSDEEVSGAFRYLAADAATSDTTPKQNTQPRGFVPDSIRTPATAGDNEAAVALMRDSQYN